jgi:hypothetical protein
MLFVEASKMFQNMIVSQLVRIIANGLTGPMYSNETEKFSIMALDWIVNDRVKAAQKLEFTSADPNIKSKLYMN